MTLKLVPRSQWGARPPRYRNVGNLDNESTCHWNGPTITVKGRKVWDHSYCAGLVRGIQNFHMDGRGWSDIAYNFVECPHGYTFEGRGINIINGANGTNFGNRTSHAICCLAGEGNGFPEAEKVGFKACVRHISEKSNAPNKCKGHRDHKATACPGDVRYRWVHAGMPTASAPPPATKPPQPKLPIGEEDMFALFYVEDEKKYYTMTPWGISSIPTDQGYLMDAKSSGLSAITVPTKATWAAISKGAPRL